VAVQLGFPPENSAPLGDNVVTVRQRQAFDDPDHTSADEVLQAVESAWVRR
jgi:hypothetical protein